MTPTIISREQARAKGLKRYFTGVPCRHGHMCERFVIGSGCVECMKGANKRAYWKNPDKARERQKHNPAQRLAIRMAYYWRNHELEKARWRDRYWNDPEAGRQRVNDYRANNLEECRARERADYAANIEVRRAELRARYHANLEHSREHGKVRASKRKALKVGSGGSHTVEEALAILVAQKYRCVYCKANLKKVEKAKDHRIALKNGGTDDKSNIQWLCRRCNQEKHARDDIEYARRHGYLF